MHAVPPKQILEGAGREAEAKAIGVTKTFALYIMRNKSTKKIGHAMVQSHRVTLLLT